MNIIREAYGRALDEHHEHERQTLEQVQREAERLELLPEGQEKRSHRAVVGSDEIPHPKGRIHGKLTLRW